VIFTFLKVEKGSKIEVEVLKKGKKRGFFFFSPWCRLVFTMKSAKNDQGKHGF